MALVQINGLNASSFADTIITKIDTIFCVKSGDSTVLKSELDTAQYNFVWVKKNKPLDTLSFVNHLRLIKSDTIIRTSVPRDTTFSLIIDTITVRFHYPPIITLGIPSLECYNGMPINLISNTVFDTTYINEKITFFDSLNQELHGIPYSKVGGNYGITLNNGVSVKVELSYEITGCPVVDTAFIVGTKFLPELNFEFNQVCFGDSTTIFNKSVFSKGLSDVFISIEGITQRFTSKENFKCFIGSNGSKRKLYASINQQGCITMDTLEINNLLKPVGNFSFNKTCENEKLVINNLSTATTTNFSIDANIANKRFTYGSTKLMTLTDTIPDGTYPVNLIIINNNGCVDTTKYSVKIDSVTYVNFSGLELYYCEKQEISTLTGTQPGGVFSGTFVQNTTPGKAFFKPEFDTMNLIITYTFTNSMGCTDTEVKSVLEVYSKPNLILTGLKGAYCEKDDPATLSINQNIAANSKYTVFLNGDKFKDEIGLQYLFNPNLPGIYRIVNFYTDRNGCFNEIENSTVVNPLPKVNLDSLLILTPGNRITVGNKLHNNPEVSYTWSNGDMRSFTQIDQPGLYILNAINNFTSCKKSDTIDVRYDKNIKEELLNVKIYPNPTTSKINIELGTSKSDIKIFKLSGSQVTVNGKASLSTDIFGKLVIDADNFEPGYYIIKIPDVGDFFIVKL